MGFRRFAIAKGLVAIVVMVCGWWLGCCGQELEDFWGVGKKVVGQRKFAVNLQDSGIRVRTSVFGRSDLILAQPWP